jgi:hypothetical protein
MHAREALAGNFFHDADDLGSSARRSKRVRRSVARLQPDPGHICLETLGLQHHCLFAIKSFYAACRILKAYRDRPSHFCQVVAHCPATSSVYHQLHCLTCV